MLPFDKNIVFTDIETTGLTKLRLLNPASEALAPWHEICEIGAVLASPKLEILGYFNSKAKVVYPLRTDEGARQVNGYYERDWEESPDLRDVLKDYAAFAGNAYFAAHNPTFDYGMLETAFAFHEIRTELDYHCLDSWSYCIGVLLAKGYHLPERLSLNGLAKFLGIHEEPLPHRAINGAMLLYNVVRDATLLPPAKAGDGPLQICMGRPTK